MSLEKIILAGSLFIFGVQSANALTIQQKRQRAAARALINSRAVVKNETGTNLVDRTTGEFKTASDVAMDMLVGGDEKLNPPNRRVRVNEPCRLVREDSPEAGLYKCAFCVSFKQGDQFVIEKLIYSANISAEDGFSSANVVSDSIQWVDRVFDQDEPCTSPD